MLLNKLEKGEKDLHEEEVKKKKKFINCVRNMRYKFSIMNHEYFFSVYRCFYLF